MKKIFKVGDRVFDIRCGWGNVCEVKDNVNDPVVVYFDNGDREGYKYDGRYYASDLHPTLSFTEYSLQGFSQERPINYEDYIGCWGRFWYDEHHKIEGVLEIIDTGDYTYLRKGGANYKHFEPYPQEVLTALGLTNEK